MSKERFVNVCRGCKQEFSHPADILPAVIRVSVHWPQLGSGYGRIIPYCEPCLKKIKAMPYDEAHDKVIADCEVRAKDGIEISEPLVREIAYNLGCSEKLTEALVEGCFGKGWDGKCPDGARMNRYENRDRLVVFVAERLKTLWKQD